MKNRLILVFMIWSLIGSNDVLKKLTPSQIQHKKLFYASSALFSTYATVKYATFLAAIKNFEFLKAKKGGYVHTLLRTVAHKIMNQYPTSKALLRAIASFSSFVPLMHKVSVSTLGKLYFGKKTLFGAAIGIGSIKRLRELKKEFND